jgi:hypothetical protein
MPAPTIHSLRSPLGRVRGMGSAKGGTLSKPVVNWVSNYNANIRSNFSVSNIAASATAMINRFMTDLLLDEKG